MTLPEIVDRQKSVIQAQAAIIAEQAVVIEQARLTGDGVDIIEAKRRMVDGELDKIEMGSRQYFHTGGRWPY